MHAVDLEYDNRRLSDYGLIICDFNYSSGAAIVSAGSQLQFETVSKNKGKSHSLVDVRYTENLSTTFHVCKDPDEFNEDEYEITDEEYLKLTRWLNREEFFRIRFLDYERDEDIRYYNGSFNIKKIKVGEILRGLELTMVTDSPYAHGEEQTYYNEFDDVTESSYLYDYSEKIGSFIPNIKITCLENGNLSISNELFNSTMIFENCTQGEIITIDGETEIVTTSLNAHDIWDDFNYEFLKIGNVFNNRNNKLTVTLECILEISYFPVIIDSP